MDLIEYKRVNEDFKRHPWELTRFEVVKYFLKKSSLKNSIVDIGSGDAFIAKSVSQCFPNSSVIAVDTQYTSTLINNLKDSKISNLHYLADISALDERQEVDFVLLMDVLEHVERPNELLKKIQEKNIHSKTHFFITVPAYQSLFSKHDEILGHFRRYNLRTLKKLLETHNLKVIEGGFFFSSLLPIRIYQKAMKAKFNDNGLHNWKGGNFITNVLVKFFWFEFKISWYLSRFGINIPGMTCYCLCRYYP